jgi:hypothetical protein
MKERLARMESEIASHKSQIADLQYCIKTLTISSDGYQRIRHRFLDIYRRNVMENVDPRGRKKIREGNEAQSPIHDFTPPANDITRGFWWNFIG